MNQSLETYQRYVRARDVVFSEIEGEFVALNIDRGQCYGMDSIASRVWRILETPHSLEDICKTLRNEYAVDHDSCRADVASLLRAMTDEALVTTQG